MGKNRFNAKARQVVKTNIDNKETSEIRLEFSNSEYGSSDASNILALPSNKRKTKIIQEKKEKIRFLSKAQRKKLEKIVDKKRKKANRASLLEALSKVQATPDEAKHFTSISAVQTLGLRKLKENGFELPTQKQVENTKKINISTIRGANKRSRLLKLNRPEPVKKKKYDPNIVGLEDSSSCADSEDSDDDKPVIVKEDNDSETESLPVPCVDDSADNKNKNAVPNTVVDVAHKNKNPDVIVIEDDDKNKNCDIIEKERIEKSKKKSEEKKEVKNTSTPKEQVETKPLLEHPTINVEVKRDPKIQVARLKLPILGEEQKIMELINENEFVIIAGETGSGKTTQLPQFLYEAGYAEHKMIGVTEPRRVATVAMSARVRHELGLTSKEVSYLMRFEGNASKDTKIKFMTDGVLLKEIETDLLLSKYSVIIIDEAHERSVFTDILLGLLSRIVLTRRKRGNPLRLIIMSATLRIEDFTENTRLFKQPPPVIKIDSRQFPVTVHFNKKTHSDYLKEAYRKTVKIHTRLPEGGILIFVTGQQEINYLVRKLKSAFPYRKDVNYSKLITRAKTNDTDAALDSDPDDIESDDDEVEKEMKRALKARKKARMKAKQRVKPLPKINLDDYSMLEDDGQADIMGEDEDSEGYLSDSDAEEDTLTASIKSCRQPLWVLPMYSMLSSAKQGRVFQPPPVGSRLCVVSTDVAETSLTIPSIKYVVDSGKKKMRVYDHVTGASVWRVVWTSQASAEQRAGRAGRVSAGHAYRLYSSAVFQHELPPQHPPELCRRPLDDLVLTLKCMGIDKVFNFPFPTAPDREQLRCAERRLEILDILERPATNTRVGEEEILKVTPLGKTVAAYPLLPRYAKMLALSYQKNLQAYVIALVSALTVPELLSGKPESWLANGNLLLLGDLGVLLRAVGAAEFARFKGEEESFCAKHGLREKAIQEIRKLRKQLTRDVYMSIEGVEAAVDPEMKPPDDNQARFLRQLVLSGLGDQVARKIAINEVKQGQDKRKFKYAYRTGELAEPVYLHSDSILRNTIPDWVVFQEIYEGGPEGRRKMIIKNVTAIEPEWLPTLVPRLCNLGDPIPDTQRYDQASGKVKSKFKGTFGKAGWSLPIVELDYPDNIDRYKWFARYLLEGVVFPKLNKYTRSLLSPPSTMVKSWAKLQPRTEVLLKTLIAKRTGTKGALTAVWEKDKKFLMNEYLKWVPVSAHNEIMLYWPPV